MIKVNIVFAQYFSPHFEVLPLKENSIAIAPLAIVSASTQGLATAN